MIATPPLPRTARVVSGDLPRTATFVGRKWLWLGTPAFGGDGLLTVTQVKEKGYDCETEVYALQEIDPQYPRCRTFAVTNLSDAGQEQPYRCTVGPVVRCNCEAGRKGYRRSSCKHKDAILAAVKAGAIHTNQRQET